jgi:hypothetical protein
MIDSEGDKMRLNSLMLFLIDVLPRPPHREAAGLNPATLPHLDELLDLPIKVIFLIFICPDLVSPTRGNWLRSDLQILSLEYVPTLFPRDFPTSGSALIGL